MAKFIRDYKGAFRRNRYIGLGLRKWIFFTLKSALLFLVLILAFSVLQYAVIFGTPLFDYLTATGVRISSICGILASLIVSFGPSMLYSIRYCVR
ncbi:hypothetical protein EAH77_04515 [Ewingella americana]|uniref:Uncharacterized protein n=1 Tax=Ewingella americana TaxID=41202 RepID=A0A502GS48_9GAMM|nr:hypothetical protein EAH77_04515 [Ewingella americana]